MTTKNQMKETIIEQQKKRSLLLYIGIGLISALAFFIFNRFYHFRNNKIHIQIALPMAMCGQVYWHAFNGRKEISSVIKVKAPQEILIGFTRAAVLGCDHARDHFYKLTNT